MILGDQSRRKAGKESLLGSDKKPAGKDWHSERGSSIDAERTAQVKRMAFENRVAQIAKVVSLNAGFYELERPDGSKIKHVRGLEGEEFSEDTWLTIERTGPSGWFVVGLATHMAEGL